MPDHKTKRKSSGAGFLRRLTRIFGLNIGTVMFGVLFVYMIVSAILYMTSVHIESYEVISGPLSRNETYTGLAIRDEMTCQADVNGYLTYYAREGDKINANGAVYGVSSSKVSESQAELTQENLSSIRKEMLSFSKSFSSVNFNSTYSFKYLIKGNILQYAGVTQQASGDDDSSSSAVTFGNQTISKAQTDGIVLYSKDGYENLTVETVRASDFDQNSYHETDLKTDDAVKVGDDVYTIITDERWSLLIPLSDKQAGKLSEREGTAIRVKFLKDGMTQTGDFSIVEIDGSKYGQIDFSKGLIRYASDRFLEIELVTNSQTGLKIPLSSIVTKEFYLIPQKYITTDSESGASGVILEERDSNGKAVHTFVSLSVYATEEPDESKNSFKETQCYVDKSKLSEGNAIVTEDSSSKFVVGDVGILEGVYCINKGYAVFCRINVLENNEEYAIVEKGTTNGITRYDHIVRNASKVDEEEVLY